MAVSHHYRICEDEAYDCWTLPSKIDRVAHRWAKSLFNGVKRACDDTFGQEGSCPEAAPHESQYEAYLRLGEDKRSAERRAADHAKQVRNDNWHKGQFRQRLCDT